MSKLKPSPEPMLRAAQLWFQRPAKTRKEIAEALDIPQRRLDNLLPMAGQWLLAERARLLDRERLVEMQNHTGRLEQGLAKRFRFLQKVKVIESAPIVSEREYGPMIQRCAEIAASYFDTVLYDHGSDDKKTHVAMSGGETILRNHECAA